MAKTSSSPEQRSHTGPLNVCKCVCVTEREKRESARETVCTHGCFNDYCLHTSTTVSVWEF